MQVPLLVENHNLRTRGTENKQAINQSSSSITIIIILSDSITSEYATSKHTKK
jgi:hypothetical protein